MAIVNRDLDASEQKKVLTTTINLTVGASANSAFQVAQVPYPCVLQACAVAANSISGAPVVALDIKRFTAGGLTTIAFVGSTLAVQAHGTSAAYQLIPGISQGSTLTQLQAGDVVTINSIFSGGNVAAGNCVVNVVVKALQDIKAMYGSQT